MESPETAQKPRIHWLVALLPFVVLVALQVLVIRVFGSDALDGASQTVLLFSAAVAVAIAMIFYKVPWSSIDGAILNNIKTIGGAILILFLIGAVSGSWMLSGVVPTMIYYGMKVVHPSVFLFITCVVCALVSLVTGSSWTTIATIGIALMGIGTAHGYSVGWTAGAIISGAYFGDKISPLSDTTVLASSVGEVPLFTHIRYMLITTVPSFAIALTVFLVASLCHTSGDAEQSSNIAEGLQNVFTISPWLLIVPVVTGVLIALRLPATIVLFLSALMAGLAMFLFQPDIVSHVGEGNDFRGLMMTYYGGTTLDTGSEVLTNLVQTRGMRGMLSTVFLIFCAAAFGGALSGTGMIQSITSALAKGVSGRRSLVSSTVATGLFSNMVTGDQYLSIVLTGNIFKNLYKEKGYEGRLLSRSTEDSATVTSVLVPWNTCGMTQSVVLKVPTIDYLPYCFFNIVSPLMSITIAMLGYKIFRRDDTDVGDSEAGENRGEGRFFSLWKKCFLYVRKKSYLCRLKYYCFKFKIMNVTFEDTALEELFLQGKTAEKKYARLPMDIVKRYVKVVNYIKAASRIEDLFKVNSLHYEKKIGTLEGVEAVWINTQYRLLFQSSPNDDGIIVNALLKEISKHYE